MSRDSELRNRVDALNAMVLEGRVMDAMHEFYADDVVMAENDQDPTVGLAANLERERQFVANTQWHAAEVKNIVVDGDTSMVQWWLDFTNAAYGQRLAFTQVAVQRWRGDKIVDERFYYTPTPVER